MFDREGNRKYLNWPEREAYFNVVRADPSALSRTFCLTLFYAGCRISEALRLTKERVDFTERALVFETLKRRQRGHYRVIPIPDDLLQQFTAYLSEHKTGQRVWPYSRPTAYRLIKRKMKEAKITGIKACPKGLRHSFAIACISRGVPLTVVQKWMGHALLETTAIYLNVVGEEERGLAMKVWGPQRPKSTHAKHLPYEGKA